MDSSQITESQGRQLQPVRAEVTGVYSNPPCSGIDKDLTSLLVLRALNVPYIKTVFGGKREYFVTIAYQVATKKAKKTKKTKSVQIEGQTAEWNQTLDPL